MKTKVSAKDIIDLLDKSYNLVYIDYRDSLDESLDKVAEAIRKQEWYPLDETIDEWMMDAQDYSMDYILKELAKEISNKFEIELPEAKELLEEYEDEIRDEIYNRDNSTPIKDLIRNTSDPVMFYDTGVEIYDGCLADEKEGKEKLKEIKKALKIKLSETKWDSQIDMMVRQGDSGRLVIYFLADINQMMDLSDKNIVTFTSPHIAIIDTWNGAGDDCQLSGHKFTIPFNLGNFFIDKEIKYSYTYQVCGMSSNWCKGTGISFGKKKVVSTKSTGLSSSLHEAQEYEKRCNETFRKGGCTPLDMDMRRHRNTFYLNEFPCGTHCPHCKTFWID